VYQLVYQVTYHLVYQVTYQNISRNVDVPELGSSRYIETQSPTDRHYQLYQVYPASPALPTSPALLHRSPCRPPNLRLSNQQMLLM
jgi:hypothetical protein